MGPKGGQRRKSATITAGGTIVGVLGGKGSSWNERALKGSRAHSVKQRTAYITGFTRISTEGIRCGSQQRMVARVSPCHVPLHRDGPQHNYYSTSFCIL